jgi:plastocyanin
MAKQTINIGTVANDRTGDPLRTAGDKINDNFDEIYAAFGDGSTLTAPSSFDQDLNTDDSPNFVNLGLAGTSGAGYATLSVTIDRDFYIGLNDTSTGAKTFQFERDGSFLLEGSIYVDGNIYGGAGNRLYLSGDEGDGSPNINIPNSINGASTPIAIDNQFGGGIQIQTSTGNWLFDDTRILHFPSSTADDYNIGESVDGFNIRSDATFGIVTNSSTTPITWTFGDDSILTFPDGGQIFNTAGELGLQADLDGNVSITTSDSSDSYVTFFNSDGSIALGGSLTFLDSSVQTTAFVENIYTFVSGDGTDYTVSGPGIDSTNQLDPTLIVYRGHTYKFTNNATGHPVEFLNSSDNSAISRIISSTGAAANVAQVGETVTFTVPLDATPGNTYLYRCTAHPGAMLGTITVA